MYRLVILFVFVAITNLNAQDYAQLKKFNSELTSIKESPQEIKQAKAEQLWKDLQVNQQIPLIENDSVYFLYQGEARSVAFVGDFNGWGYQKNIDNLGKRVEGTALWIFKIKFPKDARLDYKILIDENNWILDPENKFQQWSGVGGGSPNSELRMPDWKEDPIILERENSQNGTVQKDILFASKVLGYQISYSIYLPYQYEKKDKLPVLYVTDGYEYLHPQLGNIAVVLDNLIEDKIITPIIVILVDHREPINRANNRRMQELGMNPKYLEFFTKEFIPSIEPSYPILTDPVGRGILGASMGGLTATYFTFTRPDIFGLAGVQSPAYYIRPQIYTLCANPADPKLRISLTAGSIFDTSTESRKMKDILSANTCEYHYREVNEGHSWGNWKRLIDDVLVDLYAIKEDK
jgi:enterochelin esterase family protein